MTNDLFDKNISLVAKRWPVLAKLISSLDGDVNVDITQDTQVSTLIIDGKHLTSCYNRILEAEFLAKIIPPDSEIAHVYGVALADVVQKLLLRSELKKIHVYILSPIVFNIYLMLCDDADVWLNSPKIELHLANNSELNRPYTFSTGELAFASIDCEAIRNKILLERNEAVQKSQHVELSGRYNNNIQLNLNCLASDPFIEQLKNSCQDKKIITIAGGPTANDSFDFIKQNRPEYIIICVNSSLIALEKQEIYPNFVIAIEQDDDIKPHFNIKHNQKYLHIPLIYLPSTCPDVVKNWPGPRLVAITNDEHDLYYKLIYPDSVIFSGGSVAHSAVSVALIFGAKTIELVGYDFCYPYSKTHLEGNPLSVCVSSAPEHFTHNGLGEKVATEVNFLSYCQAMEELIELNKDVKFINHGQAGLNIKGAKWAI